MFDRFTDDARKVLGFARQEAHRLRHDAFAPEHILLGLIREGSGVGPSVLAHLDVDLQAVRTEVERLVKEGTAAPGLGQIPFTPRAKRVLERTVEEAAGLRHTYIGTEHLLLGLLREDDGVVAQVFRVLKVRAEDVREEIIELLGGERPVDDETEDPASVLDEGTRAWLDEARAEARRLRHPRVGLDHFLLVLCRSARPGRSVLEKAGVSLRALAASLSERLPPGTAAEVPVELDPLVPRALAIASVLADALEDPEVGELLLLLAIVRVGERDGFPTDRAQQTVPPDEVRRAALHALAARL